MHKAPEMAKADGKRGAVRAQHAMTVLAVGIGVTLAVGLSLLGLAAPRTQEGWAALAVLLAAVVLGTAYLAVSAKRAAAMKRLTDQVRQAQERLADLARFPEENPSPVLRIAGDGRLLFANPAGESLLAGWEAGTGRPVPSWVRHATAVALKSGSRDELEMEYHGQTYSFLIVPLAEAGYVNWYGHDITALKRAEGALHAANRRLEEQATTDALTGLANRRHFLDRADREFQRFLRQGGSLTMAMIDVDHFKAINDTCGHAAGDRALVELARLLRVEVRATDVLARYGGEEFVILMPDTSAAEAAGVAERIRRQVEEHAVRHNGRNIVMTASIGVSEARSGDTGTSEDLIRLADEAMYAAKEAGRNCVRLWAVAAPQKTGA
jgi:two-component system, cell cycle response regulator